MENQKDLVKISFSSTSISTILDDITNRTLEKGHNERSLSRCNEIFIRQENDERLQRVRALTCIIYKIWRFRAEVNKTNVKFCQVKGVKSRRLRFQGQITDEEKELANQKDDEEEDEEEVEEEEDEDENGENDGEDDEEEEEEEKNEIEDEDSNKDDGGEEEDQEENEREAEDLDEEEDKIEVEDVREDEEVRVEEEEDDERKVPKRPERREVDGVNDKTLRVLAEVMKSGKRAQELNINCPE